MPAQEKKPVLTKKEPERNLFSWQAPGRPFKRRSREFWVKTVAVVGLLSFILFIIEGIMPVILAISILFLFYVLSTVEPEKVDYKITNMGVKIADKRTDWEIVTRFWFIQRFDTNLLVFETQVLPGRLELVINAKDKETLRKVLKKQLSEEEAPPTSFDKTADWFSKKFSGSK